MAWRRRSTSASTWVSATLIWPFLSLQALVALRVELGLDLDVRLELEDLTGLELVGLHAGRADRLHLGVGDDALAVALLDEVLDDLALDLLLVAGLEDAAGDLAGAEAGHAHLAGEQAVGLVHLGLHALDLDLDLEAPLDGRDFFHDELGHSSILNRVGLPRSGPKPGGRASSQRARGVTRIAGPVKAKEGSGDSRTQEEAGGQAVL
ncbi:MAG: hypothetical protein QM765_25130 [Myxococcales bacterium]